jgi:hypothetical protein
MIICVEVSLCASTVLKAFLAHFLIACSPQVCEVATGIVCPLQMTSLRLRELA